MEHAHPSSAHIVIHMSIKSFCSVACPFVSAYVFYFMSHVGQLQLYVADRFCSTANWICSLSLLGDFKDWFDYISRFCNRLFFSLEFLLSVALNFFFVVLNFCSCSLKLQSLPFFVDLFDFNGWCLIKMFFFKPSKVCHSFGQEQPHFILVHSRCLILLICLLNDLKFL